MTVLTAPKIVTFCGRRCRTYQMSVGLYRTADALLAAPRSQSTVSISVAAENTIRDENFRVSERGTVDLIRFPARIMGIEERVLGEAALAIGERFGLGPVNDDVPILALRCPEEFERIDRFATRHIVQGSAGGWFKFDRHGSVLVLDQCYGRELVDPNDFVCFQIAHRQFIKD